MCYLMPKIFLPILRRARKSSTAPGLAVFFVCCVGQCVRSDVCFRAGERSSRPLTALGHHALLCLRGFCLAHGSISRSHLDHPVPSLHARATAGAALVPLTPLCDQAAAGSCSKWAENIAYQYHSIS